MQDADRIASRFGLQRWVSYITSIGALVIAAVNLVALVGVYGEDAGRAIAHPTVSSVAGFGLAFLLTSLWDSRAARIAQVLTFAIGGMVTALANARSDLTSAIFVVFAMVLLNEYVSQKITTILSSVLAFTYIALLVIGIGSDTASVTLNVLNLMILSGVVILLFGYVSYRQNVIRRRHETQLESLVAERTVELREALGQRDTMLQEIHHRVGNSLQLLASFVSLQQEGAAPEQEQVLRETVLRVHAIADVHATLYSQHQLSHLPLAEYSAELISDMQIAYRTDATISADFRTAVEAHIDFSISFGIVLNELVTNATKHGASGTGPADIVVQLESDENSLTLTVRDKGPGFPDAYDSGIGSEVVDQLVYQNDGEIRRLSDSGGVVTARFPLASVMRDEPVRFTHTQTA